MVQDKELLEFLRGKYVWRLFEVAPRDEGGRGEGGSRDDSRGVIAVWER